MRDLVFFILWLMLACAWFVLVHRYDTATEEEKEKHKAEIETCGGFLKTLDYKNAWRLAWNKASVEERKELFDLPNWDNKVFKEITGIDAEAEIAKE